MNAEQLNQYQEKLITMREEILKRISSLSSDRRRKYGALDADFSEQATQMMNDEVVDSLDDIERSDLTKINNALVHIQNKTYGTCIKCGTSITLKRLNANPFALNCIKCANEK